MQPSPPDRGRWLFFSYSLDMADLVVWILLFNFAESALSERSEKSERSEISEKSERSERSERSD